MTMTFTAVYENGVLRPTQPIAVADGVELEVTVRSKSIGSPDAKQTAAAVARIAALPIEGDATDPFAGRDHDKYLYGELETR